MSKGDPGVKQSKKRVAFAKRHASKTFQQWQSYCQGCGDLKEFTWYPRELQPQFKRLRASWTYMTKAEKKKPQFQRPKKWFPKKDWQKVKKQKVFGLTTSNGKMLHFCVPSPWTADVWAKLVKKRVGPFLKRSFPRLSAYRIILDSEPILHAPVVKAAYREWNITVEPHWPKYSPDLNPQENVWSQAEPTVRLMETGREPFEQWTKKVVKACNAYPSPQKLIGSMARRCKQVLERQGAMADS